MTTIYAHVFAVTPARDPRASCHAVEVNCPFCGGVHGHGWRVENKGTLLPSPKRLGARLRSIGLRCADCGGGNYIVIVPPKIRRKS